VSDGATVLCTNKGDVVAFHGYTSKKIGAKQHGIEKIEVSPHLTSFISLLFIADQFNILNVNKILYIVKYI
jgi:hypothetical protein